MRTETTCRDLPCDASVTERPRYYARQLITPDDMTLEQEYFRSKLRQHNRYLHGWGVVCGALVSPAPKATGGAPGNEDEPWKVVVSPGYILGPSGDEINIDCNRTVDLRSRGVVGITGEICAEAVDPWCSEVFEQRQAGKLYVAVRYKEVPTRPVRVQAIGCGCDDTSCEYSRLRDGYEIRILTSCPDSHKEPPKIEDLISNGNPECLPCPDEQWVVLAEVQLGENGKINQIDNCVCRRMVLSLAQFWWQCHAESKKTLVSDKGARADSESDLHDEVVSGAQTTSMTESAATRGPESPGAPGTQASTEQPPAAPSATKTMPPVKRKSRKGTDEE